MADRESALGRLGLGDIFHARSPKNRASLVCVVTAVDRTTIYARRIHAQDDLRFDRQTGIELGEVPSSIDCVAPLPPEIHNLFVEMDRKYQRITKLLREGVEFDLNECKLTPDEKRANSFIDEHISANPI
jgi:hypothetical protein